MAIDILFDHASSIMTVISFITFGGILWWAYGHHQEADFAAIANLPLDEDEEKHHG
jgi:cytochrome c oxidase cbb3-type subunit 4